MQNTRAQIPIVDDEEGIRDLLDLLRENLEEQGYVCYTAASGESALDILADHPVDLALLDMMMPGMTGLNLFRHMTDRFPDTAVIFDTAVDDLSLAVRQLKDGAYDYIVKPVARKRLLNSVEEALYKRNALLKDRKPGGNTSAGAAMEKDVPVSLLANIDGTVSIMFTDIEGSTEALTQLCNDENRNRVMRQHVANHGGCETKTTGDGFMMVFPSAKRAAACALDIQRNLQESNAQYAGLQLNVRIIYDWIKDPLGDIAQDLPALERLAGC